MLKKHRVLFGVLTALCCMVVCLIAGLFTPHQVDATSAWELRDTPVLVVTGSEIVISPSTVEEEKQSEVTASLSNEKAYSLAELSALPQTQRVFSTLNSGGYRKQYLASGVDLVSLLKFSGFDLAGHPGSDVTFYSGSYKKTFDDFSGTKRYRYPQQAAGSESGKTEVGAMLALKTAVSGDNSDEVPAASALAALTTPTLTLGATNFKEMNNSSFIRELDCVQVGEPITDNVINILGTNYSRAQLLAMERVTATYTYQTKRGVFTDKVRGIALADLVKDMDDTEMVTVSFADGYKPTELTIAEIKDESNRYMLGLEKLVDGKWEAIYSVKNGYSGIGAIFNGKKGTTAESGPLSMIAGINTASDNYSNSPFKHISYIGTSRGAAYAADAITGATLTIEGPGVTSTTPIMVSDLEGTDSANLYRGEYTDTRNGVKTTLVYEGVTIQSIIEGLVNTSVKTVSDDIQIVFKNRWRQDVCTLDYSDIKKASAPVIMAYGTGTTDGKTIAPFVYNNEPGIISSLGNDDGGLKLVYNAADFSGTSVPAKFGSVAYIYVEFVGDEPGFKHSEAADIAYSNVENTEYLITFTGSALGREVNLTVGELENMVTYDLQGNPTGLGYRSEYGLSNTTYWYVNTYEGVILWDLLLKLGVDGAKYKNDDSTLVSFASWDNYKTTAAFSMKQLANPDLFFFYEKSPSDIGTDRPSKEQLAQKEYQPDNQIGVWTKDSNGYPVKSGYPVMIAYGVNGYPYVRNASMDGYYGGLGNDGGPVRVIFGKSDNMNRSNTEDVTNYAYFYNNGSNQMQRAQEIYVGDDVRYCTHSQNPSYIAMADDIALTVDVVQTNGAKETENFTLKQLEDVLYGSDVDKTDRDNEGRQEKAYYQYAKGKDALFEGVNLWYLLSEHIGMQGSLGTVVLYSGDTKAGEISLSELKESGGNSLRGTSGFGALVAFARNGYPLVESSSSTGYVGKDVVTGIEVNNAGGPLAFVCPQYEADLSSDKVAENAYVANLTRIVVKLEPDKFAHIGTYAFYADKKIAFTGALTKDTSLKVSEIEKMQKYMVTDSYTVGGKSYVFRGIDLYRLLNDTAIGASALAESVTISNEQGQSTTLSVTDLSEGKNGQRVILAYGVGKADASDGVALVPTASSAGYNADYGNSGGVMRLVIQNGTALECITNVSKITIKAAEVTGWTHTYSYYESYLNLPILRITGDGLVKPVTFTVGQLESLVNEMVLNEYKVTNNIWFQGVDLYKLLLNYVELKNPGSAPNFTAYAKDAYATTFKGTDLSGGINGKPMIVAYGQGNSQLDGLPLVEENTSAGYDPNYDNAYGPIRLIVNDNSGWCVKWLRCIVIGNGSFEDPADYADDLADIKVTVGNNGNGSDNNPVNPTPAVQAGKYKVVSGDYLIKIAREQLGNSQLWRQIYLLNKDQIRDPNLIYPGQMFILP